MARFDKQQVMAKIGATGMVPVFYHKDLDTAKAVLKACYDGGVRAFEFTNRGDFAHEIFGELVKFAATECPEMALGVGSIVDPASGVWLHIRSRLRPGGRLRPLQGIPRRRTRCEIRERTPGTDALEQAHGHRWCRTHSGKPVIVDQSRCILCRNGIQALPQRPHRGRGLAVHHREMHRSARLYRRCPQVIRKYS